MPAPSGVQMVPRLPETLTAPQATLVYHQPRAHPSERVRTFREPLGLASLALFPMLRHRAGRSGGDAAARCGACRDGAGRRR